MTVDIGRDGNLRINQHTNRLLTLQTIAGESGQHWEQFQDQTIREGARGARRQKEISEEEGVTPVETVTYQKNEIPSIQPVGTEGGGGDAGLMDLRDQAETYGVGVRSGMVTAQKKDEQDFRVKAGLSKMSGEAEDAWKQDGGIRRPVTLQSQSAFEATQDQLEEN